MTPLPAAKRITPEERAAVSDMRERACLPMALREGLTGEAAIARAVYLMRLHAKRCRDAAIKRLDRRLRRGYYYRSGS